MAAAALSTAAWIAHDLGIATGVGGALFGRLALGPAVRQISDHAERGRVVGDAWRTFDGVRLGALAVMAATWFAGRSVLTGREVDETSRALTIAEDALVVGTLATAVGSSIVGRRLSAERPGGRVPLDDEGDVAPESPASGRALSRAAETLGIANLICGGGVVAVTAILAMRSGRSAKWSALARLLG